MKKIARTVFVVGALIGSAVSLGACSYGSLATVGERVVVPRNDGLLFGALRKVYVCNVTEAGLSNCVEGESP